MNKDKELQLKILMLLIQHGNICGKHCDWVAYCCDMLTPVVLYDKFLETIQVLKDEEWIYENNCGVLTLNYEKISAIVWDCMTQ